MSGDTSQGKQDSAGQNLRESTGKCRRDSPDPNEFNINTSLRSTRTSVYSINAVFDVEKLLVGVDMI